MFKKTSLVGLTLIAVAALVVGTAQAGTWETFTITSDATARISNTYTYLQAVNFGSEVDGYGNPMTPTINGVNFTVESIGADTGNGEFYGTNYSGYGRIVTGVYTSSATGNVNSLLRSYFKTDMSFDEWGSQIAKLNITGLSPSTEYTVTLYRTGNGAENVGLTSKSWSQDEFGEQAQETWYHYDETASGVGMGISYVFTTDATGTGSNQIEFRLPGQGYSGFTVIAGTFSEGGSTIPEPSTLALLATGLIGLLAYAWRKRK